MLAMGVAAAVLGGVVACKREAPKMAMAATAPRVPGPTTAEITKEQTGEVLKRLDPIPDLGQGMVNKTPDGEVWTQYSNGLMIHDLKPSDGRKPKWGQTVGIAYVGTYPGETKVFDHRTASDPLTFELGSKNIVKGMNMGISTMGLGGKRRIFMPGELAYGKNGNIQAGIGSNQPLIFEVELVSITGQELEMPKVPAATMDFTGPAGPPAPGSESGK
jgi:FKBP-type peptidyl-prolyl cis-trans isomerase